jgi:hypothetical protein
MSSSLFSSLRHVALAFVLVLAWTGAVLAQSSSSPDGLWTIVDEVPFPERFQAPTSFSAATLDLAGFAAAVAEAPRETPGPLPASTMTYLLLPDGTFTQIAVEQSPVLDPDSAAMHPEIQTYAFESLPDRAISGRLTVGPGGLYVFAQAPDRLLRVEPVQTDEGVFYLSYFDRDRTDDAGFVSHVDDEHDQGEPPPVPLKAELQKVLAAAGPAAKAAEIGDTLRTYRIALATTGEYYQSRDTGNGFLDVLLSLVVEINNVNAVFEPELGVRLTIAPGTFSMMYSDPTTDPFVTVDDPMTAATEGSPCDLREQNRDNTKAVLADADYDLGFLMATQGGTGGSGCAWFVVCLTTNNTLHKARGAGRIGLANTPLVGSGTGLLLHEVSHQLGSRHTYSGQAGGCNAANFESADAYAPGSGTTIGSYRGVCGSDNVDTTAVPAGQYFHTRSFERIADNTQSGGGSTCGSTSATGNLAPAPDAGPDYTIPRGTPFELEGSATDADPLTYTWEQFDLATTQRFIDTDDGIGPIIRSVPPTSAPARIIPNYPDLLAGIPRKGEILPIMDRDLTFRFTARDNRMGGGGVAYDTMVVHVDGDPFFLTSPNGGESLNGGCSEDVTWVAGGSNTANVDLEISDDGGTSFSPLALGTPNDGSQSVTLPCTNTAAARAKASGTGNIFFDVSDANFSIAQTAPTIVGSATGGEVDDQCMFEVPFQMTVADDCSVNQADVDVMISELTGNAMLSSQAVHLTQQDGMTVDVMGSVVVSGLTSSPAIVRVTVTATDGCGLQTIETFDADVVDTTPPTIDISLDPDSLWPPNHKLHEITASVEVMDNCPITNASLLSIVSDEPDNGTGDGDTADDIQEALFGTEDLSFLLRSERMGGGDGRVYTVTYGVEDGSGNEASDAATVIVPLSKGN